jgi:hypothetical protein
MWICLRDGFISIVQDRTSATRVCVRARRREHLERLFPEQPVFMSEYTDYRWRVFVTKKTLAALLADRIDALNYTNFKESVADAELHDLYLDFWTHHRAYQDRAERDDRVHPGAKGI